MRNFQEKKKKKKVLHSKPVLIIFGILLLLFIYNVLRLADKASDTKRNREIAEEKIKELEAQKLKLEENIEKLKTDEGIEENIRERFGLGKEGEGMIVIVEDENKDTVDSGENKNSFWNFIKNLFN
jgi:cell division protein FtsB